MTNHDTFSTRQILPKTCVVSVVACLVEYHNGFAVGMGYLGKTGWGWDGEWVMSVVKPPWWWHVQL